MAYQIDGDDEQNRMQVKKSYPMIKLVTLGCGQKVKYHLISITKILYQALCLSQIKDTKHIRRDFHSFARVMPQGWDFGALGSPGGQFFCSNMVMWHIKSTGMTSRTECK